MTMSRGINKKLDGASQSPEHREGIINALNKMIEIYTSHSQETFEEVICSGLKYVACAADLDRVAVYRLLKKSGRLGQIYVWAFGTTAKINEKLMELPNIPPVANWLEILTKGECINGNVHEMPEEEAEFCESFGIKSILFVPIFTHNEFWGVVTLEDLTTYRYFNNEYLDLLQSAARLCANAFIRNEMKYGISEAEELRRAVTEASPIPYVLFDEDLHAIDCNNAAQQIFACPDKQYLLDHYWDSFVPELQPDGMNSYTIALSKIKELSVNKKKAYELLYRTLDGELIPMENTMTQVMHKGKKLLISFKYDMRGIKRMMKSLQEQDKQLEIRLEQQELISGILRGFVSPGDSEMYIEKTIERLGKYLGVSAVFISKIDSYLDKLLPMYNWSAGDLQQFPSEPELPAVIKSSFPKSLSNCDTLPVISCADTSDSSNMAFRGLSFAGIRAFMCVPLYVEGRLWGTLSAEQYPMPRHWTENEKSFFVMMAGTIAGVIMRNIYNTMIKTTLEKATMANKAKSSFLSNISHEIRTPLNRIIGMTLIGKNTSEQDRKNYALDKIEDTSTYLLGVINNILDMSKIESNKFDLLVSEFSFEKIFQMVVNAVNFRVEEKRQNLRVYIDREIPDSLIGDGQRFAQVITNLVENAVKFTPVEGSIRLGAEFLKEEDGLCTIKITVTDTGIGISPEQQEILFQPFQQADNSVSRKFGGTGLGLTISKNIIEMMGGRIWIKSEPGMGSSFMFTVQLKRGKEKTGELLSRDLNNCNARILAVDDDKDTLMYITEILHELGVSCDTAWSGEEVFEILDLGRQYDIYIINRKLPGIDGVRLTRALKAMENNPDDIYVLMYSSAFENPDNYELKEAGVDKLLSKPLFPSVIKDAVCNCLFIAEEDDEGALSVSMPKFAGRRILLAEDLEINREIVVALLEPTEVKIDCAENGAVAVKMYSEAEEKYDMIFMDIQMPEMDGLTAVRTIRAMDIPGAKTIPIIAMTANVFKEDIEDCLNAGMNAHLGKPLNLEEVLNKMRTFLLVNDQAEEFSGALFSRV